ncbi:MAG: hypothetical protein GY940_35570 [bacterium]|nr:hypothetical protein [bacterium]
MLKNMNKAAKPERYKWGIQQLKKNNIDSFASLICGFPGETEESIRTTMNFIEETGAALASSVRQPRTLP